MGDGDGYIFIIRSGSGIRFNLIIMKRNYNKIGRTTVNVNKMQAQKSHLIRPQWAKMDDEDE